MSQDKKEQILAAASECFTKFGYKKTTLDDIGKKVGLNKASLYYYFKSKEEIFTILVLDEFKQFITKLHQDIEENMKCEQKILVYFEKKLNFWFQKSIILPQITETEPEALQHMMTSGEELYLKIEEDEQTFLANILKKCIENGQIRDCNSKEMSRYMFALSDGIKEKYMGFNKTRPLTLKEHERIIKDVQAALIIFINGLK